MLTPVLNIMERDTLGEKSPPSSEHAARPSITCIVDANEAGPGTADAILGGRFCLNGEAYELGKQVDWRHNPSADREWLILLNKFYFAPALTVQFSKTGDARYLHRWMELTQSWIDQGMEAGFIAADVTGRRIQNWCMAYAGLVSSGRSTPMPEQFSQLFLRSLESQANWLRQNVHQSRNHRTLELYALLLCAMSFPQFAQAAQWREFAIGELSRNALADFRPDGGHCEQSIHYHCIVLRNQLQALQLMRDNALDQDAACLERLRIAAHFAARMHMPNGEIAAFSDSDRGSYLEMLRQAAHLFKDEALRYMATGGVEGDPPSRGSVQFSDSGYYVLRSPWKASDREQSNAMQLIFDCGPLGEGNHGHFDLLSFEAQANGHAVVIDPGRFTYDESGAVNWRAAFRGTAAHSTVEIDGLNQVRYEQGVRKMKVRGLPPVHQLHVFHAAPDFSYVHGSCDGSQYAVRHQRRILQVHDQFWIIFDDLQASAEHTYRARVQLAPQFQDRLFVHAHTGGASVQNELLDIYVSCAAPHTVQIESAWVSSRYGHRQAAPRLCTEVRGQNVQIATVIVPRRREAAP
jgi:uncharacterized heparinase superfamily protein